MAFMQVLCTFIGTVVMDKAGRKMLLIISSVLMLASNLIMGTFFYLQQYYPDTAKTINWLPLFALIIYIASFSFGWGPVPWVLLGEILPSKVRIIGGSIGSTLNWLFAFIISLAFDPLQVSFINLKIK